MAYMAKKKNDTVAGTPWIKSGGSRTAVTLALVVIAFAFVYLIAIGAIVSSALLEWGLALAFLFIIGWIIKSVNGWNGFYGIYLFSTRHGINFIDNLAKKHKSFWINMSLWGVVLGFGLLSYPLLKGKISKKMYAFGMVSLILIILFVLPATSNGLQFINLPQIQNAAQSAASGVAQPNYLWTAVVYTALVVAGFSGYVISALWYNAGHILLGLAEYLASVTVGAPNTSTLTNQIPGVAPLIPGLQIPLVAGVISLAILLIIHEGSHGVLSRIAKVRLKSVGLLLYGVIPIGAFVEPDEKEILKLDKSVQSGIFAAGIAANFVAMVFFFVLMTLMIIYLLPGIYNVVVSSTAANFPAYNVLHTGDQILYWNGYRIQNMSGLEIASASDKPGSLVTVVTNNGTYKFTAIAYGNSTRGLIGITSSEAVQNTTYANVIYFLYSLVTLSFLLNLLVGIVNLLPIPAFDGWRVYGVNIKNKKMINYIAYFVVLGMVINVLPWLFIFLT
jgi:hypothetical protein